MSSLVPQFAGDVEGDTQDLSKAESEPVLMTSYDP